MDLTGAIPHNQFWGTHKGSFHRWLVWDANPLGANTDWWPETREMQRRWQEAKPTKYTQLSPSPTFSCPMVLNLYTSFSHSSMFFPRTFWHFLDWEIQNQQSDPASVIYQHQQMSSLPRCGVIVSLLHQVIDVSHPDLLDIVSLDVFKADVCSHQRLLTVNSEHS